MTYQIRLFTDGSSRGNPGPGGFAAIAVYPNSKGEVKVDELGGREENTTNNRMELMGAISALELFDGYYDADMMSEAAFTLHTDSSYLINGITKWVKGWQKNNWMTATKQQVLNKDLWQRLAAVVDDKNIKWTYVAGHSGIPANERCDEIATAFADGEKINLYRGGEEEYPVNTKDLSGHLTGVKKSSKSSKARSAATAYSYVALLDGKIFTFKTWKECEAVVKGKKGVKYKKALTLSEEKEISSEFLGK